LELPISYVGEREIVRELVEEILSRVHSLKVKASAEEARVCFVLDGEPLHAKRLTHKSRKRKSYSCLKKARKLAYLYLAKNANVREEERERFLRKFYSCAYGWIRWSKEFKNLVVEEMRLHNIAFDFCPDNLAPLSTVIAGYEADPKCIDVARCVGKSIIFSNDGDLLVYPYADNAVVCKA
jgi:hypothetical protein